MSKCADCEQEMPEADSCLLDFISISGTKYARQRYHFNEPSGRCHDCGIKHGGVHHFGCDVELCPKCGCQLISCDCVTEYVFRYEKDCPTKTE